MRVPVIASEQRHHWVHAVAAAAKLATPQEDQKSVMHGQEVGAPRTVIALPPLLVQPLISPCAQIQVGPVMWQYYVDAPVDGKEVGW